MSDWWNNLRLVWANTQWSWIVLWLGLTVLIVALFALMRTRWGQSQPLGKCAVLSLIAHLLLAVYATTVQIVTASSAGRTSESIRASFVDGADWEESVASQQRFVTAPSDASGENSAAMAPITEPARIDALTSQPQRVESSLANEGPAVRDPFRGLDLSPALSSAATPLVKQSTTSRPAEDIDEPTPQTGTIAQEVTPDVAGPDRISTGDLATDKSPKDPIDDGSSNASRKNGLSEPLSNLPSDAQFNTGSDAPLRSARSPAELATKASDDTSSDASSGSTKAKGSGGADPGSLLVPVKAMTGGGAGDSSLPPIYKDRVADDREAVALRRGGSAETEAAVRAALRWLAENQSTDGRWDADRHGAGQEHKVLGHDRQGAGAKADTAVTGLALLALLGAGNTHLDGKYKDNVKRGLEYLLSAQADDGNLGGSAEMFAFMYSHGIATLALSEAYAMTADKRLERPLRAAIAYTVGAQHPTSGGWRYRPHEEGDTSQLGWQLMALKSAELSGLAIPEKSRAGMVRFLKSVSSGTHGGLASYRPRERATRAMTAEALVCRQFLGMTRDNPAANEAGDYLLTELPSNEPINLYYWYYGTLGTYQLQGEHWRKWNAALQKTLLDRQVTRGAAAGSWDPDCIWAGYGGRVYSTAMATLCLEVYYRYLPLYGELGPELREAKRGR
jgi:hypothetical protein